MSPELQGGSVRHPNSYVDPHGTVFVEDGRYFRAIHRGSGAFVRSLLDAPSVRAMIGTKIVGTVVTDRKLADTDLVLEHRTIPTTSYCYEWAPPMLKDAALLHVDIGEELVGDGFALQDAYPWNVLFDGPDPVFVDFTSIIPEERDLFWIAYSQFASFFLYPLYLTSHGFGDAVRGLLHDYITGISPEQFVRLLPNSALIRRPGLFLKFVLPYLLSRGGGSPKKGTGAASLAAKFAPGKEMRREFFRSLRRTVTAIDVERRKTAWADYHRDLERFLQPSGFTAKEHNLAGIVERLKPASVVDIGCNQGGYSIIAERRGARVVAFDSDESAVSHLYRYASKHHLRILPLMVDVANPSPSCGHRAAQFSPSFERCASDMAFALAIVHHLAITQRQSFDRIAEAFSDYGRKYLLTEFVPPGDEKVRMITSTTRRDLSWYTMENFLDSLKRRYAHLETFPSFPDGRILILCSR